jgi:murein DD-endopeptidase MepM/ murein hydrolase activator NlpD
VGGVKTQGLHGYNGIDIGAAAGTSIVAAAPGTVIIARSGGWNGGYGSYVVVQHGNGTQTLYAHASSVLVSQGQQVTQGQAIARVGATGRATGNHLHFEVRGAKNPF